MLELPSSAPQQVVAGLAYWNRIRSRRKMPSRADIDPLQIPRLLPYVMLVDVLATPLDFKFRLVGSRVDEIVASSYTGTLFSDLPHMARGNSIWSEYEEVVMKQVPLYSAVQYVGPDRFVRSVMHCLMPLSADGGNVDMIFVVASIERD